MNETLAYTQFVSYFDNLKYKQIDNKYFDGFKMSNESSEEKLKYFLDKFINGQKYVHCDVNLLNNCILSFHAHHDKLLKLIHQKFLVLAENVVSKIKQDIDNNAFSTGKFMHYHDDYFSTTWNIIRFMSPINRIITTENHNVILLISNYIYYKYVICHKFDNFRQKENETSNVDILKIAFEHLFVNNEEDCDTKTQLVDLVINVDNNETVELDITASDENNKKYIYDDKHQIKCDVYHRDENDGDIADNENNENNDEVDIANLRLINKIINSQNNFYHMLSDKTKALDIFDTKFTRFIDNEIIIKNYISNLDVKIRQIYEQRHNNDIDKIDMYRKFCDFKIFNSLYAHFLMKRILDFGKEHQEFEITMSKIAKFYNINKYYDVIEQLENCNLNDIQTKESKQNYVSDKNDEMDVLNYLKFCHDNNQEIDIDVLSNIRTDEKLCAIENNKFKRNALFYYICFFNDPKLDIIRTLTTNKSIYHTSINKWYIPEYYVFYTKKCAKIDIIQYFKTHMPIKYTSKKSVEALYVSKGGNDKDIICLLQEIDNYNSNNA